MAEVALTRRQSDVMLLVCDGHSLKVVADKLGISRHTAKFHLAKAMRRLGGNRISAAVRFALANADAVRARVADPGAADLVPGDG